MALLALALGTPALAQDLSTMDLEDLMEIEVTTVSKQARRMGESPAAVTVLTQDDIRRSGALSLPELLRGVPGLHVAQIDATHWSVSSRGFSDEFSNKLLVMVDGRSIYAPIFSGVLWNEHDLMLEDIERIEVVRGPGGTLWGANAVNGVIHIKTKPAAETQGVLTSLQAGSYEKANVAGRYGHAFGDRAHMRVYGKFADRDDFESPVRGSADDDWQSVRTGGRFDWRPTDSSMLTLQGDYYESDVDRVLVGAGASTEDNDGANVLLRLSHAFSDTSEVSLQGFWDRTGREQGLVEEDRDTFDVELQHSFSPLARNFVVWGAGYRTSSDDIDGSIGLNFSGSSRTDELYSFFVQDEITILPNLLALTVGTKLEDNDYTGLEVQPSGRLLFTPTEKHVFWGAVSRAVRTPSRVEDDVMFFQPTGPTTFQSVTGSHDVDSEDLLAYELGFRSTPHPRVNMDVALFWNDYDHLRSTEPYATVPNSPFPGATTQLARLDNELSGDSYGAEFAGMVRLTDWLRLSGTYTFTRLELSPTSASNDVTSEDMEGMTPRHQFGIRSQVDLPWDLELDTALFWVDRLQGQGVSSYTRVDARLAWQPMDGVELSIVGLNLAEEHTEFPNGTLTQASKVPRSVYGSIRWDVDWNLE
ncbi:MAG: TonB-dependent receptor plug domain-containing protein [Myxococcota bacterium]